MPKYYCDYCDTFLTHDSPSVRRTHCQGRKHKDNVREFYQKWMEEKAQLLIDNTTAMFKDGRIQSFVRPPVPPPFGLVMPPNFARLPPLPMFGMLHSHMIPPQTHLPPPSALIPQPSSPKGNDSEYNIKSESFDCSTDFKSESLECSN